MKSERIRKIILSLLSVVIFGVGIKGYQRLAQDKKKIISKNTNTSAHKVKVISVVYQHVATKLTGYGTVRGKREVVVISEVGGKIVWMNPNFESGKRIKKN